LDVGIVVENSKEDHRLISDVLASFVRKDGRNAGRRMMEDSNARMEEGAGYALEEERFLDKIEGLTVKASGKGYFMEHLGKYIAEICNAAAAHHVMLNQAFISAALAVKVQEGIALALDPSIQIWRIAIPIILEGERRHGYVADRAKEMIDFKGFFDWLRGTTQNTTR
jgi:predicted unusual protein kinase regulating ubiquinone biosynthesis (AarF/ABC1/UbiB family)